MLIPIRVRSIPVSPEWHVKDPGHCHKCRWQITPKDAYTFDPTKSELANYAAIQAECGDLSGNELTRNPSRNTQPQSSQLAESLMTDLGLKGQNSVRELIST